MAKILAAMSGGVDSSVAAGLMVKAGHEVVGLHMRLHDVESDNPGSCCGQQDAKDAAAVAEHLNIPFMVTDLRKKFRESIISNFIEEYKRGRTPIPCTHCNGVLKFGYLVELASILGCDYVCTGHYARINNRIIMQSIDRKKDQTYFLWNTDKKVLNRILFPVGEYTKEGIRTLATEWELPNANKVESQDLCFIPEGNVKSFLESETEDLSLSGKFIDADTLEVLGFYANHTTFTIGQRKGLSFNQPGPWFVKNIYPEDRVIYLTRDRDTINTKSVTIEGINDLRDRLVHWNTNLSVRFKHRGELTSCTIQTYSGLDKIVITPEVEILATPGQAAVFYENDTLVGGGWIR